MEEDGQAARPPPPKWVPIVLGLQLILAIIILGLSGYIIHGHYFNTLGFTIFLSLLTWIVVVYSFTTLYITSLKQYRIQYAVLGVDIVMTIFWLSAMGASAALRASFKYSVTIDGCYNDGGLVNSSTCIVERAMEKRAAVATSTGLSILSAIAGLSALELLLYVVCLVFDILAWNKSRSKASMPEYAPQNQNGGGYQMEAAPQQPAMQQYNQQAYAPQDQQPSQFQTQPYTGYQPNPPVH